MTTSPSPRQLARRGARMKPSVIRERLKLTKKPGIISFSGGLPSRKAFPVAESEAACAKVLRDDPAGALHYAASEGYGPLREKVADMLPWNVEALCRATWDGLCARCAGLRRPGRRAHAAPEFCDPQRGGNSLRRGGTGGRAENVCRQPAGVRP